MLGAKETQLCTYGTSFTCQCVDNSLEYCGGSKERSEVNCGTWTANCPIISSKEECCG
jgi:hypothetical protein